MEVTKKLFLKETKESKIQCNIPINLHIERIPTGMLCVSWRVSVDGKDFNQVILGECSMFTVFKTLRR